MGCEVPSAVLAPLEDPAGAAEVINGIQESAVFYPLLIPDSQMVR